MVRMETGAKFNMLTLLDCDREKNAENRIIALFLCDCGKSKKLPVGRVKSGVVRSCGCIVGKDKKHGMHGSRTYESWSSAKNRCMCETSKDYPRYGGKGITFYQPWADSFDLFLQDMGKRPGGTSLDRKDNTKGYYPGNCKWSTPTEQQQNRKDSHIWFIQGERFESATAAALRYNVSVQTIHRWVKGYKDTRKNGKQEWGPKDGCSRIRRY